MVIVPKSTMGNWCNEFRRFCPTIRVTKFHGNQDDRVSQQSEQAAARSGSSRCLRRASS